MPNQILARGLFLAAIALAFGVGALRYPLGSLTRAGPGLFPLLVSGLLLAIAILTIIQSRVLASAPMTLSFRNIFLVLLALVAFVVLSEYLDMIAGIVALVFIGSAAGSTYSWKRNLQIAAVLIAIAFAFQRFLGLNLPLV